ncbi:response regulator transcription factor [Luteolibacter ambystomatis]|uniref:Response regulator transcription factor n=1 Tax=Luteolibacter ambystomatis TaxID=2824561 RepID=A0A975J2W0_9BACT|nr:response regulator transcription factor [Luteolibacter ambystomatis]QUE52982.1 response regulator transcription factor [Luteolibacter ambystomatis]
MSQDFPSSSDAAAVVRVAIVEDDDWIRDNLAAQIDAAPGFTCTGVFRSAEDALREMPRDAPDVVLMDINLPGMSGIECVKQLKMLLAGVDVLMLTVSDDNENVFESLKAGASGYLLKRTATPVLLRSISEVLRGGGPMSGSIARKVIEFFNRRGVVQSEISRLTPREREILDHLADGAAYKEIADALGLAFDTVRMHIKGIYRKLHVHSRGEAVAKYLK